MWFKKAIIYQLSQSFSFTHEQLEDKGSRPLGAQESINYGWFPPLGLYKSNLHYNAGELHLFCMRKEEKQIPASVVKEALDHRVANIEQDEGRKVYGKEKAALKDDILSLLKPKAMAKSTHVYGYVDRKRNILVIDASPSLADAFIELMIDTLGSLGAVKLMGEKSPSLVLNDWIIDTPPVAIELTGDFKLEDPKDDRAVTIKSDDSHAVELLEDGYWANMVSIDYQGDFRAKLDNSLHLSSINFSNECLAKADMVASDSEDEAVRFDADFHLMSETLGQFYESMTQWFDIDTTTNRKQG